MTLNMHNDNNNKRGGRRSTTTTFHNNAAGTTSRAYQPHRPGYHWEPAKQPLYDDNDDFLQRIVHGSCQGVPSCQGDNLTCHSMAEQLDLFTVRTENCYIDIVFIVLGRVRDTFSFSIC